jgi:hypothetical protein
VPHGTTAAFSASLPPAGRLPSQRWLHVVVLYAFT